MSDLRYSAAQSDFKDARRKAAVRQLLASLKGQSADLLSFDTLRQDLKAGDTSELGLQDIPLEAIVGSVDRYQDYTRSFLPKVDEDAERWARLKTRVEYSGMEPISVFKLGQAYFVSDGHHRVSIAGRMGFKTIQALVTEVEVRVDLDPEDSPEEIICKARLAEFLARTDLDKTRPQADFQMTLCGQYRIFIDQIEVVRYLMELDPVREKATFREAAQRWFDTVYTPMIRLIHQQGLEHHFPELKDADLYILVARHRAELRQELDWHVDTVATVSDLTRRKSRRPGRVVDRFGARVLDALTPDALEAGPPAGLWRRERLDKRPADNLFADILVAGRGLDADYNMVRHAAEVARRENGRLLGLRILKESEQRDDESIRQVQEAFDAYCREMGLRGEFAVEAGPVARKIVDRAAWADLLVLSLVRRHGPKTATGFGTHFNKILQRSPRPVLVVPEGADSPLDRALLAYDGSPKADEALYAAAYFASRWELSLVVLTAGKKQAKTAQGRAQAYLEEQEVAADYRVYPGPASRAILETMSEQDCNLLLMGGFGFRPLPQLLLGSTVDKVLDQSNAPVLICR